MKKTLSLFLALCTVLSLGATLAACNKPHVHDIETDWSKNETHHWHECTSCDEISDKEEHFWDNGRITAEPTPEADGTITFVCYVCHQTTTTPAKYSAPTDNENNNQEGDNNQQGGNNQQGDNNQEGGNNQQGGAPENTVVTTVKDQAEWLKLFEIENCTIDAVLQIGEDPNNVGIVRMKHDGNRAVTETSHGNENETIYSLLKDNILYQGAITNGELSYYKVAENLSKLDIRYTINFSIQEDFSKVTYDADKKAYISVMPNETHEIYVENGKIVKIMSTIGDTMKGYATIEISNFGTTVIESFPEFCFNHIFGTTWTYTAAGYWHACTNEGCAEKQDFVAHRLDEFGLTADPCDVCGYGK